MFVQSNRPPSPDLYNRLHPLSHRQNSGMPSQWSIQRKKGAEARKSHVFFYKVHYILFGYGRAVYTDAFTEIHQVGRGVKAHAVSPPPAIWQPMYGNRSLCHWFLPRGLCGTNGGGVRNVRLICACFPNLLCMPSRPLAETWVRCYISKLKCSDSPSFIKINGKAILSPY